MASQKCHKYTAVPLEEPGAADIPRPSPSGKRSWLAQTLSKILIAAVFLAISTLFLISNYKLRLQGCEETATCTDNSRESWGQYSPYFPTGSKNRLGVPSTCKTNFVQVLSRHGSRGPTTGKYIMYAATLARLQSSVTHYAKGFEFIRDYELELEPDQLTWYGEKEMVDLGDTIAVYFEDVADGEEPFVRASGSERVVASAHNFTQGFYAAQNRSDADYAKNILVIPEEEGFNNTLDHGGCPYFEDGPGKELGVAKQSQWKEIFVPPIQERLNRKLKDANLSLDETVFLMDLCPFNTVATHDLHLSRFCSLFSQAEWESYDYYQSIEKWYVYGPGRKLGPTQGVGFVNELIARLTGKAVDDHTSTNSTLDSSPDTYPLDRKIYADFSHDNTMMAIYSAMGLFSAANNPPLDHIVPPQELDGYSASWAVPFAARMYVEKMACASMEDSSSEEEFVRVHLNGRVVTLQGCDVDKFGRCTLMSFLDSLSFARSGGRWGECAMREGDE